MVLGSHYQKPLEFSFESLDQAENAYLKLKNKISSLDKKEDILDEREFNRFNQDFKEALANNVNTSMSLTVLYDVLKHSFRREIIDE